jgi:hypothetical protein
MSLNTLTLVGLDSTITNGCTVSDGDFEILSPIKNRLYVWSEEETMINGGANTLFADIVPKEILLTELT